LLFGTMIVISGGMGGATVLHRAYFKFAGGVQPGAPVRYGGMLVGKVRRVRVDPGNSTRIEIELTVNRDAPLKTDSVAKISTPGCRSATQSDGFFGQPEWPAFGRAPESFHQPYQRTGTDGKTHAAAG